MTIGRYVDSKGDVCQRFGIIEVGRAFYKTDQLMGRLAELFSVMGFVPVDTHYDFFRDTNILKGWCEDFRPIKTGDEIPYYELSISREGSVDGPLDVTITEIEPEQIQGKIFKWEETDSRD